MSTIILKEIDLSPLLKANAFLSKALLEAQSDLEKAGAIQSFEFCYELSWKILKRVLAIRGVIVNSPRETYRAAAREGLIDELDTWFEFIRQRNMTTHSYNEIIAKNIFSYLPHFSKKLTELINTLNAL